MDQLALEVDVLPAKAQHFAAPDTRVEQDRQQKQVLSFQQMKICFNSGSFFPGNGQTLLFLLAHGQANALGRVLFQQTVLNGGIEDAVQQRPPVPAGGIGIRCPLIVEALHILGGDVLQPLPPEVGNHMLMQVHLVVDFCASTQSLGLEGVPPFLGIILKQRACRIGICLTVGHALQHPHLLMEGLTHLRNGSALHPDVPELGRDTAPLHLRIYRCHR